MDLPAIPLTGTNSFLEVSGLSHSLPTGVESVFSFRDPRSSPSDWKWYETGKRAHTFGIQLNNNAKEQLLQIISATNQNGENLKLIHQTAVDGVRRILLFHRLASTKSVHLKLALPEVETFEFIARPEFVE